MARTSTTDLTAAEVDIVQGLEPLGSALQVVRVNAGGTALEYATAGAGDMVLASTQTVSGLKTFLAGMFALRNVANTFSGLFTNTNTADRTYTLQNRDGTLADNTDLALKANLASPTFTGTVTLPSVQLGEASVKLDAALSADGTWSGITETGTAGATLAFGDLCYFQASDSRWELADANVSAGYDKKLGMCVLAAASDGTATEMLLIGKIRADANFPTLTIGSPVYMAETAGDIVVAQPVTADACIRVIGYANTADELYFNPSSDYIIHV